MPIRQGRKVTELTALDSASLNTYVVGVDNNITYKISLDVLEDAVVKIVSSSTDARLDSIESYTASIDVSSLNSSLAITDGRLNSLEQATSSFFTEENSNPSENNFVAVFGENNKIQKGAIFVTGSRVIIGGPSSSIHEFVPEAFAVYSQLDGYNLISGHGNTNNYLQLNIKNFSDLSNASSDVVATANNGDEESFYVNMGINGSGYDEDTIIGTANDTYVYGYGNVFHMGNASEYPVYIFAGGFDARGENLKMVIDPQNNHTLTGSLSISGGIEVIGTQHISGTIQIYDVTGTSNHAILFQQDSDGTLSVSNGEFVPADGIRIPGGQVQIILKNDAGSEYDAHIQNIDGVGMQISASGANNAILEIVGHSLNLQNTFTASLSEGYIWVGDGNDKTYLISTSSFATTGSNKFIGDQTISGSQYISGSIILTNGSIINDNKNSSISFGKQAAEYNQGTQSVAIGQGAGNYDQNNGAVAVGANAGGFNQGLRATAIGSLAGGINQGEYAVAIGNFAGGTDQASNSIIINATGTSLDNTITSSLKIAPIRNITGSGILQYNDITKEVSYSNIISGSTTFVGINRFETVGGDEGGEIEFGVPETNTTLSTRVVTDVYQNRFRIFDGNTKGVFIDLSKAPTGVAGELTWKSSGIVNAGTFVSLDNIKVTVTSSGNRGLSVGAVSTSFSANIGGTYSTAIPSSGGASANNVSYTTTASTSAFGWNFGSEGDTSTYIITDKTNSRVYRVTLMIGASYNNNFISIERLH